MGCRAHRLLYLPPPSPPNHMHTPPRTLLAALCRPTPHPHPLAGARLVDMVVAPHVLVESGGRLRLHAQYYITKQILPALERVLSLVRRMTHGSRGGHVGWWGGRSACARAFPPCICVCVSE